MRRKAAFCEIQVARGRAGIWERSFSRGPLQGWETVARRLLGELVTGKGGKCTTSRKAPGDRY